MTVFPRFRRFAGALAVVALSVSAAACSGGAAGPGEVGEPRRGGDVIFLESGPFTSFAQQDLRLWQNSSFSVYLFELLQILDSANVNLETWLATDWAHKSNHN